MMNLYPALLLSVLALTPTTLLAAEPAASKPAEPVRIIFDTDMETDCDDAAALAILHALADNGECRILATISCALNASTAPAIDVINTYYGRPDTPIGNVKGDGVKKSSRYTAQLAARFPHDLKSAGDATDAVRVYRQVLEKQPDQSVTIVTVGYLTNVANLIRQQPQDGHLSGADLVRRKVKLWVCMGGNFLGHPPQDNGKLGNHNFEYDAQAALYAINNWPTPIVFAGREVCSVPSGLKIGENLNKTSPDNPVRAAYKHYFGDRPRNRHVADPASVLFAVRGARDYWEISQPGRMQLQRDMTFQWIASSDGAQRYLLKKTTGGKTNDRYVEAELDRLLTQPPSHQKK